MGSRPQAATTWLRTFAAALCVSGSAEWVRAQPLHRLVLPEQRCISVHEPDQFAQFASPADAASPATVRTDPDSLAPTALLLDDAIQLALRQTNVVRVLAGSGAASTGQTIYDPAISHARIDQEQAAFDPTFEMRHDFLRNETPLAVLDPFNPGQVLLRGARSDTYDTSLGIAKRFQTGGTLRAQMNLDSVRRQPQDGILDPTTRSDTTLGLTQPLLRGAGRDVNQVPILLARIDTESSYFRLKDGLQETVRGVIQGYWDLVAARTEAWAVDQQLQQVEFAVDLESARLRTGSGDQSQLAQAKLARANLRASRIGIQSNLLEREAAFRGVLGLPPNLPVRLLPMSAPVTAYREFDWVGLLDLSERNRPDLIELKLVLEADYQLILQANNQRLPQLDAVALYRWNGLEGELPVGTTVRSGTSQFTDWQLGINFSVPLGLRQARAVLRERELLLAKDRANIEQAMLEISHELAASLRRLDQAYAQYQALQETRLAAIDNLRQQIAVFRQGRSGFINVSQAITDWGNAVSGEARALAQYNAELATLERQTGTILESYGVRLFEERQAAIGPLGVCAAPKFYPAAMRPSDSEPRHPSSDKPVDEQFHQDSPDSLLGPRYRSDRSEANRPERLPPPEPSPPSEP